MLPLTITPLAMRHLTDAAFYWLQLDQSETAFRLPFDRVALFNERIEAHLQGLAIAGPEGLALAFAELERWRKPGEAFVCVWLAGLRTEEEQLKKAQEIATQGQDLLATANDCTRARKCNLVPYNADGLGNPMGKRKVSKVESAGNGGCCPGQTGHHLIPEASIQGACPNYDHGAAPTVCVEGTSQNMGSHMRAHQTLANEHKILDRRGKVASDGTMSMDDALDAAAESHQEAFPASKCSEKCIRAQLEAYYRTCRGGRPGMVDAQAKKIIPERTGSFGD